MPDHRLLPFLFPAALLAGSLLFTSAQAQPAAVTASPRTAAAETPAHGHRETGAPSTAFEVAGMVVKPGRFDLVSLRQLPQQDRDVRGRVYRGASVWDFLNTTVGLAAPATRAEGLRRYVIVSGSDGYQALFSLAELDPTLGAQPLLIATELDGKPLGDHGFARIVAPNDGKPGRWVSRLVRLEVLAAP